MTSSVRRGGYEPLPEAGEYVCDCYEHGTGEPWAHVGSSHVHERVVRCRDCKHYTDDEMEYYHYCGSWCEQVTPDGYCAWGERRESE